jgi:hypothetical protein
VYEVVPREYVSSRTKTIDRSGPRRLTSNRTSIETSHHVRLLVAIACLAIRLGVELAIEVGI